MGQIATDQSPQLVDIGPEFLDEGGAQIQVDRFVGERREPM